jgi:hypothetical protein
VSRWMVIIHRASKIFLIQPMKRVNSCISILLDDEVNKMTWYIDHPIDGDVAGVDNTPMLSRGSSQTDP